MERYVNRIENRLRELRDEEREKAFQKGIDEGKYREWNVGFQQELHLQRPIKLCWHWTVNWNFGRMKRISLIILHNT